LKPLRYHVFLAIKELRKGHPSSSIADIAERIESPARRRARSTRPSFSFWFVVILRHDTRTVARRSTGFPRGQFTAFIVRMQTSTRSPCGTDRCRTSRRADAGAGLKAKSVPKAIKARNKPARKFLLPSPAVWLLRLKASRQKESFWRLDRSVPVPNSGRSSTMDVLRRHR